MVLPGGVSVVADCFLQVAVETVSGQANPGNRATFAPSVRAPEIRFENSIPRAQTGCTRAKMPPHY
jgi:hypothetical protein